MDTFKTTLQVQGSGALELLKNKVKQGGVGVLYSGAAANCRELGRELPWFATIQLFASERAEDGRYGWFGQKRGDWRHGFYRIRLRLKLFESRENGQANERGRVVRVRGRRETNHRQGWRQGFVRERFTNENVDQRDAIDGVLGILEGDREVFERQSRGEGERASERRKKKKASFTMAHADAFGLPPLMKRSIARDCEAANGLIVA